MEVGIILISQQVTDVQNSHLYREMDLIQREIWSGGTWGLACTDGELGWWWIPFFQLRFDGGDPTRFDMRQNLS
jgi:hypothetical protein